MAVGSFIEIFLTTFGWHLYDVVWAILASTGLAYLPILAAIIDNVISPIESQEAKSAAVTSLRRLEIDIVRIIVMMMLAVSPSMTLEFGSVSHSAACQNRTYHEGQTGTIFDDLISETTLNGNQAEIPPLFYLVMSITGGINDAIITSLPCELNVRELRFESTTVRILDPHLRRETQVFVSDCYKPARADFFNNARQMPDSMSIDDINWIGSQFFNDTYYKTHYARSPVPSFSFDPQRASDAAHVSGNSNVTPASGYPSCWEWWNDSENGIRNRLSEQVSPSLMDKTIAFFNEASAEEAENIAIRQLITNEGSAVMSGLNLGRESSIAELVSKDSFSGFLDGLADVGGDFLGTVGGAVTYFLLKPAIFFVKESAPYIQSAILFGIYFLLPFILVVGNYEWKTIKTALITIFAIKIWTPIWAVIDLLDDKLAGAIRSASGYDGIGIITGNSVMLSAILDVTILSLYIGMPYFFMSMLSWAGQDRAASGVNSQGNSLSSANKSAGDEGKNGIPGL